jgi:hypothetical protein
MSVGEITVGVMTVGVMSVGEITVGVMTVGVMSVGEITVGVMTVGVMRRPHSDDVVFCLLLFCFRFSLIKHSFICIHFIYRLSTMLCDVTYQKTAHFTRIKIFKDNILNINILTNKI